MPEEAAILKQTEALLRKAEKLKQSDLAEKLEDIVQQLQEGKLDVAMFVSSPEDSALKDLQKQSGIHLLSFRRDVAYSRLFAYLTPVKLAFAR